MYRRPLACEGRRLDAYSSAASREGARPVTILTPDIIEKVALATVALESADVALAVAAGRPLQEGAGLWEKHKRQAIVALEAALPDVLGAVAGKFDAGEFTETLDGVDISDVVADALRSVIRSLSKAKG